MIDLQLFRLLFLCFLSFGAYVVSAGCNTNIAATTPTSRFVFSTTDEVVIDKSTGLMWKRCIEGYSGESCEVDDGFKAVTYEQALANVETLNKTGFAGFKDWRMPNIKELRSIVEESCSGLALNEEVFPYLSKNSVEQKFREIMSNTPRSYRESGAVWVWGIDFDDGSIVPFSLESSNQASDSISGAMRLVRNYAN
jgi:hypothetical protein